MGIPLSFPFLNLIHIYVCEKIGARRDTYYVCGDDLIAVWPIALIEKYKRNLPKLTGMLMNVKKSFISKFRGIFCERAFHYGKEGLFVNRQFLSVKALTPLGKFLLPKGAEAQPSLPWELAPLLYLDTHYARLGHSKIVFVQDKILTDYVKRIRYLARKYGVSPYFPLSMGGAGLYPHKGNERVSPSEESLLRALESGDANACDRLRMVRLNTVKASIFDRRGSRRTAQVTKQISYSSSGPGLAPSILALIGKLRAFNEDLSAAEGRAIPEDVPAKLWFRALGSVGQVGDRPPTNLRTYKSIRSLVLYERPSKWSVDDLLEYIAHMLPDEVFVQTLLNEQLELDAYQNGEEGV